MLNTNPKSFFLGAVMFLMLSIPCRAQISHSIQLLQRAEIRNGYGKPLAADTLPATFSGSRARIGIQYEKEKVTIYTSIQDVRIFGSTSQLRTYDPFLSVYEVWAELRLDSSFTIKIGRQELNYDNARFLGNVDWIFPGRTHDFGLIKYHHKKLKLDIGGGYNQNGERLAGNAYTVGNQYKTAQLIRTEFGHNNWLIAFLFWNDGRQFVTVDSTKKIVAQGMRYMQTYGIPTIRYKHQNLSMNGFVYYQGGIDARGKTVYAYDLCFFINHLFPIKHSEDSKIGWSAGSELISGSPNSTSYRNTAFSPLYGTNHIHNGYMDYFFVGNRYEGLYGLSDNFLRTRIQINKTKFIGVSAHYFLSQSGILSSINQNRLDPYLGTEIDVTAGFQIFGSIGLQAGYSRMFTGNTLLAINSLTNAQGAQHWGYLMVLYRPGANKLFTGLLF